MSEKIFLTIFIPVYNGSKYIKDLLKSFESQICQNFEVIFIDDCSTDNSYELINDFIQKHDKSKYRILKTDKNLGAGHYHLKNLPRYINGEYYFSLTQDDFLDADFVQKLYAKYLEDDYDIIFTDLAVCKNGQYKLLGKEYMELINSGQISNRDLFKLSLKFEISIAGARKLKLLKEAGYFDDKYYNIDEYACRLSILMANKISYVETKYYYRKDNPDATTNKVKPFTFDCATTELLLIELLIKYGFEKSLIKNQINDYFDIIWWWNLHFYWNNKEYSKADRKYLIKTFNKLYCKLFIIILFNSPCLLCKYFDKTIFASIQFVRYKYMAIFG